MEGGGGSSKSSVSSSIPGNSGNREWKVPAE